MRLLTNLMVAGALIFGFILIEHHYHIADRLWQFRGSGTTQPSAPAVPASPAWNVTPDDHDYKVIIDVSGKGPFMTVVHGPDPVVKKGTKKSKKTAPSQQVAIKDQPQNSPQFATTPQPQISSQPKSISQPPPAPQPGTTVQPGTKSP